MEQFFRVAFQPVFGSFLLAGLFAAIILLAILWFRPRGESLPSKGYATLILLRLAALGCVLFVLFRVSAVFVHTNPLDATVFLLVDTSESMTVQDEMAGRSRFEVAQKTLTDAAPAIATLSRRFECQAFTFSDTTESVPLDTGSGQITLPPISNGKATAIGSALEHLQTAARGKRLVATILLSDGTQRARPPLDRLPLLAAQQFRDADSPIYPVRLGSPGVGDTLDIAVREFQTAEHVFVNNELTVSGSVLIAGYENQRIPVELHFEGLDGTSKRVAVAEIEAAESGQLVPYQFRFLPSEVGLFKLTVSVPGQPREMVLSNNDQSTFVRVLSGGLKVLYIEGTRRIEQRFIRAALDQSPDIHVEYWRPDIDAVLEQARRSSQVSPLTLLQKYTEQRPSLTDSYFQTGQYLVYIIGDVDSAAFKPEELQRLAKLIEQDGCGVLFLGGLHAFGAGGYGETALAPLFPVQMYRSERQPFGGMVQTDSHIGPLQVVPTQMGRTHFLLRLSADILENTMLWKSFPELDGANKLSQEKPSALTLLQSETGQPILVAQLCGAGRSLSLAVDSTWKWQMAGFGTEYKRFWRQTVLWLAKMDDSLSGDCWITLDKKRCLTGDTLNFQVFLQSKMGEIVKNPKTQVTVVFPDGTEETVPTILTDGYPIGSFRKTEQTGDYTFRVTATTPEKLASDDTVDGGEPPETKTAIARFTVTEGRLELDNPVADPKTLESIATITGGRTIAPEQLPSLLEEIQQSSRTLVETRETRRPLYNTWPLFLTLIGLLSAEWFLRKRWGLV